MKRFKTYINEYLDIHQPKEKQKYEYAPESLLELRSLIKERIGTNGRECDLNDIDVSNITDMSRLFFNIDFDGDISKWDTYNVKTMVGMFAGSTYTGKNGDISNWDTTNVTDMNRMFYKSKYDGDLSKWDVFDVKNMNSMFAYSDYTGKKGDISNWNLNSINDIGLIFYKSMFDGDVTKWDINPKASKNMMFYGCPGEQKNKKYSK